MTYKEVIDTYLHPLADKSGFRSVNYPWSDEFLIKYLLIARTTVLKEKIDLGIEIPKENYQTFCLELQEASKADCPCAAPKNCVWMKSINKVPRYIKDILVTNINGDYIYSYESWQSLERSYKSRVPSVRESKLYTIKNGHIILPMEIFIKNITVTGLFEDPYLALISSCNSTPATQCNPLSAGWATDLDTTNVVLTRVSQILPNLRNTGGIDILNNDNSTN